MTSFVTQCPHCQTSFRVSRTQLAAAQGVVRCGACMELFNAARHLHSEDTADSKEATPDAVHRSVDKNSTPSISPSSENSADQDDTLWIHDDLDLDSLDLDEELAKLERQELELSHEFLELKSQHTDHQQLHVAHHSTDDDEAWAEQLLSDDAAASADNERQREEPANMVESGIDARDLHFTPVTPGNPAPPSPLAKPSDPVVAQLESPGRTEPAVDGLIDLDDDTPHATSAGRSSIEADEPNLSARNGQDDRLFELEDEPLQLDWEERRRPWGRWLGWGLLNLIALLALAAQYVTYNFDELARQDEYRPWLERICPAVGCQLPPRVDISQIKSSNLVVRSHPDFAGALVVDAIIYNRAPFAQPFPLLEVRFADLQGQTLARRTFKPGEYLSGELAGQREMPSQIPIHIALDILDPGITAVNYSLSFRSPD
jgi:predicted Zn finger-like uncharacterized protein